MPLLKLEVPLRFVFPNAPVRPVTINGGMEMRAWYDIDPGAPLSGDDDIRASAFQIEQLLVRERGARHTVRAHHAGGFLPGRRDRPASRVCAIRSGSPASWRSPPTCTIHEHLTEEVSFASVDVPIFMAHGLSDPMIPIARAVTSREALLHLNYQVEWHEYGMGHQVCPEEINDIAAWLNRVYR